VKERDRQTEEEDDGWRLDHVNRKNTGPQSKGNTHICFIMTAVNVQLAGVDELAGKEQSQGPHIP
jgi:hypothetical protein